ncbi:MAG: flippase-like domain-containing protein [Syntrophaceae bacterium]|nr:flippase-like domain-containing protein [Syntrophaceae bacterium]
MNKKIFVGILLSIILVYLSVRGININETIDIFKNIKWLPVAAFIIIILFMQFLRSYRWGVILKPLQKIDQLTLFSVTSVGFLAIAAIPARLGELARPYLISKKSSVKFSSAFGTIIIERALDGLAVLFIMIIALLFVDLPSWMIKSGIIFLLITLIFISCIVSLIWQRERSLKIINRILNKFPGKLTLAIERIIHHLIDGFKIITDIKMLFYLFFLSVFIWLIDVMAIYALFLAFGFNLPVLASVVLMIILIAGIAIPTAPGYIGNWHFACILGLSLFGVAKPEALSFALVYHFLSIVFIIVLGIIFLPFNKFSIADIKTYAAKTKES